MTLYTDSSETPDRRRHNGVVTGTEKRVNAYVFYGVCVCLFVCLFVSLFLSLYTTCKQKNKASVLFARPNFVCW